jgi:hypothetical protein
MTSKAFTPWWRLLQDCIGYRAKLHRWSPTKYDSPGCLICFGVVPEDLFHFAVGCFDKWQYWCNVFILLDLTGSFGNEYDVWAGLVSLSSVSCKPLPTNVLVVCFCNLVEISLEVCD